MMELFGLALSGGLPLLALDMPLKATALWGSPRGPRRTGPSPGPRPVGPLECRPGRASPAAGGRPGVPQAPRRDARPAAVAVAWFGPGRGGRIDSGVARAEGRTEFPVIVMAPPDALPIGTSSSSGRPRPSPTTGRPGRRERFDAAGLVLGVYLAVAMRLAVRLAVSLAAVADCGGVRPIEGALGRGPGPLAGPPGDRPPVGIRTSAESRSPSSSGLRPTVILPESLADAASPRLDAVLVHELAHVRRGDYAWNLMRKLVQLLYWPHPLTWPLGRVVGPSANRRVMICVFMRWVGRRPIGRRCWRSRRAWPAGPARRWGWRWPGARGWADAWPGSTAAGRTACDAAGPPAGRSSGRSRPWPPCWARRVDPQGRGRNPRQAPAPKPDDQPNDAPADRQTRSRSSSSPGTRAGRSRARPSGRRSTS